MNFESPNTLVFIGYKEFVQKIFQTTKICKNMSRIFFTHPLDKDSYDMIDKYIIKTGKKLLGPYLFFFKETSK